ncbi:hypothetical protein TNCV_3138671 [Trichonephila clavipes]|nr:hypothetical protein TNCV_3138671 [Trichonephila clavipes]
MSIGSLWRESVWAHSQSSVLQTQYRPGFVRTRKADCTDISFNFRTGMGKMVRVFDHPFTKLFPPVIRETNGSLSHVSRRPLLAIRGKKTEYIIVSACALCVPCIQSTGNYHPIPPSVHSSLIILPGMLLNVFNS